MKREILRGILCGVAISGGLLSGVALFPPEFALSQVINPGIQQIAPTPANNDCAKWVISGGNVVGITGSGAACANISAIPLTQNNVFVGSAGNIATGVPLGGDCTIVAAGTITCTKTNNVSFAASATTDTTNAANISSGALPLARLALANGSIYIGGAGANPVAQVISQDCTITNAGVITCTKTNNVAFAASATTDTTNATNIASGTLNTARLPSPFTSGTRSGNTSTFVTATGALTSGNVAKFDVNGNVIDGGAAGTGTVTSVVCATTTITTTGTCYSRGQIIGTNTNDNATAGNFGEYISSSIASGSAVSLTTGTPANVTSVSLTAGDWDCTGNVITNPAGSTTQSNLFSWISSTSATVPTLPNGGGFQSDPGGAISAGTPIALSAGSLRFSLAGTTTIFLSTQAAFAVSTNAAYGFIGCRRAR